MSPATTELRDGDAPGDPPESREALFARVRASHPRFGEAVVADALLAMRYRGEGHHFRGRLHTVREIARLAWVSDAFLAQALYRAKARLQALGVPVLPRIAHRLAIVIAQVSIGDPVVVRPGVYIVHGQVVVDGVAEVGSGVVLGPFVTIGLRAGNPYGPTVGDGVQIGAGAKLIGPVRVGGGATIGANAVVVSDVTEGTTVVGAPARPV